uniref:(northern house mosquito) hypothetical protein n=1 Tax=Culex pipiens TaxID=7175 RepID=A0A8D8FNS0_CULPI
MSCVSSRFWYTKSSSLSPGCISWRISCIGVRLARRSCRISCRYSSRFRIDFFIQRRCRSQSSWDASAKYAQHRFRLCFQNRPYEWARVREVAICTVSPGMLMRTIRSVDSSVADLKNEIFM